MKNLDRVLVLSLFGGYTLKAGILGATLADAIIILGLASAHFLYNYFQKNREIEKLKLELSQEINNLKVSQQEQMVIVSEIRSNITGLKLNQNIKKVL